MAAHHVIFDFLDAAFPLSRPVRYLARRGPDWEWFKLTLFVAWLLTLLVNLTLWIVLVLIACTLVGAILGWPFLTAVAFEQVRSWLGSPWVRLLAWMVLVLIAFSLYQLRKYLRSVYGCAEILVGLATCWTGLLAIGDQVRAASQTSNLAAALALSGGVYIIVQGLDTYEQGRKESG